MFYNTTNETNPDLQEYRQKAMKQDDIVMRIFMNASYRWHFTPSEIEATNEWVTLANSAPITSIRRSLTNLTDAKKLVKTKTYRLGLYGRPEHVWTLPEAARQMELI